MSEKFDDRFKIKSSRLIGWDYSNPGNYFITICTYLHNNFFGKIINNQMILSDCGGIAKNELLKTFAIRKNLELFAWVIMPNHIHILFAIRNIDVETHGNASLLKNPKSIEVISNYRNHPNFYNKLNQRSNKIIPKTIKLFKGAVTRDCNQSQIFFSWQPRYYDEIIQTQKRFYQIKNYIINNPKNWVMDKMYDPS